MSLLAAGSPAIAQSPLEPPALEPAPVAAAVASADSLGPWLRTANGVVDMRRVALPLGGDTIIVTIQLANFGDVPARDVRVQDLIPTGHHAVALPAGAALAGDTLRWPAIDEIQPGRARAWIVRLVPDRPAADTASPPLPSIPSNARVAAPVAPRTPEPPADNPQQTVAFNQMAAGADLDVALDGPVDAAPGAEVTFTIRFRNAGPENAHGVDLDFLIPAGAQFVSANPGGSVAGNKVTWSFASLGDDLRRTYTVRLRAPAPACASTITGVATIAAASPADPDLRNNTSSHTVAITGPACEPLADVAVSVSYPEKVESLDSIVYTIDVVNHGPEPAQGVVLADTVPFGSRIRRTTGGGVISGNGVEWTLGGLQPGQVVPLTLVYETLATDSVVETVLRVRSASPPRDPDLSNNVAHTKTSVVRGGTRGPPDLEIRKTGPARVQKGDTIVYVIVASNPDTTQGLTAVVSDALPPTGIPLDSAFLTGRVITWPAIYLGPLERVRYAVRLLADKCSSAPLVNVALLSAPGDPNPGNNVSMVETEVPCISPPPEPPFFKEAVGTFRVGATGVFRFTVPNPYAAAIPGPIEVTDTLPAGLTFVTGTGPGWRMMESGGVIRAIHDDDLPSGTTSFEATVLVDGAALPEVCNTAWVQHDRGAASWTACVRPEHGELTLSKRASKTEVVAGDVVDYRLVVRVSGTLMLEPIAVTDTLPGGFRFVPGSVRRDGEPQDDPPAADSASVLVLEAGIVAADDSTVITYRLRVGADAEVEGVNKARARSGQTSSNTATASVLVRRLELQEDGLIAGKIWLDGGARMGEPGNRMEAGGCRCGPVSDGLQTDGEPGIPGVRVWLQDGRSAITDREGRFVFEGLRARSWVVRIDETSLPNAGLTALRLSNRHADNGLSVVVDLTRGELGRADFAAGPISAAARDTIDRRRAAVDSAHIQDAWVRRPGAYAPRPFEQKTEFRPLMPGFSDRIAGLTTGGFALPDTVRPTEALTAPAGDQGTRDTAMSAAAPSTGPTTSHLAIGLLQLRVDQFLHPESEGVARDRFEDALRGIEIGDDPRLEAGARAALLYTGRYSDGWSATLRLDTEPDDRARFFGDIRPDEGYPIYGDGSISQFGAQSRRRYYGRIEKGASSLTVGDFTTSADGAAYSRRLGDYARTLNGVVQRYESGAIRVIGYASRADSRQVIDVLPGAGISGPYTLSRRNGLLNSERVELVTRDRDQPALIVRTETLQRFTDYDLEPLTGRLVFRRPVPMVDDEFNPVEIRVSYEVEGGGDQAWIWGANAHVRPVSRIEVGGGYLRDDLAAGRFELGSAEATVALTERTFLTGEMAFSDSAGSTSGSGSRVEIDHTSSRLAGRAWWLRTDADFLNPSSPWGRNRDEAGLGAALRLTDRLRIVSEWLRTEDRSLDQTRSGGRIGIDAGLTRWLTAGVGYRHADETDTTTFTGSAGSALDAIGLRLTVRPPEDPRASAFAEYEQHVSDADRRRAVIGADYRVLSGVRLYGRHELISSLAGPWQLSPDRERNTTVFGVAVENRQGQALFSEYRVRDAIAGRDAQAAIGLRNSWKVEDGIRLSASVERQSPLHDGGPTATAVTAGAEFTGEADWKGSVRAEYRDDGLTDNFFGSAGYVRRLSREVSVLGNLAFSVPTGSGPAYGRSRVGLAWRDADGNRWNALARWEVRHERDTDPTLPGTRNVQLIGGHASFLASPELVLRADWLTKLLYERANLISTNTSAHVAGARATLDIGRSFDAGIVGRGLFSGGFDEARWGTGVEIGARLADNLRVFGGYNVFGFDDRDLSAGGTTERGFHFGIGYAFDENVLGLGSSRPAAECRCKGPDPHPQHPQKPKPPEKRKRPEKQKRHEPDPRRKGDRKEHVSSRTGIELSIIGTTRIQIVDTLKYIIETHRESREVIDSMVFRVHTSRDVRVIRIQPSDSSVSGGGNRTVSDTSFRRIPPFDGLRLSRSDTLWLVIPDGTLPGTSFDLDVQVDIFSGPNSWVRTRRFTAWIERQGCRTQDCLSSSVTNIYNGPTIVVQSGADSSTTTLNVNVGGRDLLALLLGLGNRSECSRIPSGACGSAPQLWSWLWPWFWYWYWPPPPWPPQPEPTAAVVSRIGGPDVLEVGRSAWYHVRTTNAGRRQVTLIRHIVTTTSPDVAFLTEAQEGNTSWTIDSLGIGAARADSVRIQCARPGDFTIDLITMGDANGLERYPVRCFGGRPGTDVLVVGVDGATRMESGQVRPWSVTARNAGPDSARISELELTLPPGYVFVDTTGNEILQSAMRWFVNRTLAPGSSVTQTVRVRAPADAGTHFGAAAVSTATDDLNPDNNVLRYTSTTIVVDTNPPLFADIGIDLDRLEIEGRTIRYTLTTTNQGNLDASDVRVTVAWTHIGVGRYADAGGLISGTGIAWNGRLVRAGESIRNTFVVDFPRGAPDSIRITASATTFTVPELNPDNNGDSRMVYLVVQDTIPFPGGNGGTGPGDDVLKVLVLASLGIIALMLLGMLVQEWIRSGAWPFSAKPGPGLMPIPIPIPLLRESISYTQLEETNGTGYLIAPDRFVTCAHVVRNRERGKTVALRFRGEWMNAVIESIDTAADVAVLRLSHDLKDGLPLELSLDLPGRVEWQGMGFRDGTADEGTETQGVILQIAAETRWGDAVMIVTAPRLIDRMVEEGHAFAGSPVLVDGKVVGHIRGPVANPVSLNLSFASLVEVVPVGSIRQCSGFEPARDAGAPGVFASYPGRPPVVRIIGAARDTSRIRRLAHLLEGSGVRLFLDECPAESESEIDATILVNGRGGDRAIGVNPVGVPIVVCLDDTPVPAAWTGARTFDATAGFDRTMFVSLLAVLREVPVPRDAPEPAHVALEALVGAAFDVIASIDASEGSDCVRAIALRWQDTRVCGTAVQLVAADRLLAAGRPDQVLDVLAEVPVGPCATELLAISLDRCHRTEEAVAAIQELRAVGSAHATHLEMLGAFYADLAEARLQSGAAEGNHADRRPQPQSYQRKALQASMDGWEMGRRPLAGLRALLMALELGLHKQAADLAKAIEGAFGKRLARAGAAAARSLAAARLAGGHTDTAAEAWRCAVDADPDDIPAIAAMLEEAHRILALSSAAGDRRDAIEAVLRDVLGKPEVGVAFDLRNSRHVVGSPEDADALQKQIAGELEKQDIRCGVCCVRDAFELAFAEAILARNGRVRLIAADPARDAMTPLNSPLADRVRAIMADPRVTVEFVPAAAIDETDGSIKRVGDLTRRLAGAGTATIEITPESQQVKTGPAEARGSAPEPESAIRIADGRTHVTRDMSGFDDDDEPRAPATYERLHCVAVGINRYTEWPPLHNAVNDAKEFAQTLEREFGFHSRLITDAEATRDRIRELFLDVLPDEVGENDLVVFFFAGHGHTRLRGGRDEHGYLIPVQARLRSTADLLPLQEVVAWTEDLKCKNALFIFDSCFSGIAAIASGVTKRGGPEDARVAISAGTAQQKVQDSGAPAGYENHSVFTGYLLQALAPGGVEARRGAIRDMDLFMYIQSRVEDATRDRQTPVWGPLSGHGTGTIRLVRSSEGR